MLERFNWDDVLSGLQYLDDLATSSIHVNQRWRGYLFAVEYTVHGLPWIIGSFISLLTAYGKHASESTQYGLAVLNCGLLLDLVVTGIIKVCVQRPRPPRNQDDQFFEAPIADQFSFPSGHTSRAAMLATICSGLLPPTSRVLWLFPVIVGTSRVAMGRHYVSDVLAGILFGYIEGKLVLQLPMSFNRLLRDTLR